MLPNNDKSFLGLAAIAISSIFRDETLYDVLKSCYEHYG